MFQSGAGTTVSIAGLPVTYDSTGFGNLTFTPISEVVDLPAFGRDYTEIKVLSLGNRAVRKLKGSYDNGNLALKINHDNTDAGQAAVAAAALSDSAYSFKIVLQDGEISYFTALVMSNMLNVGNVDSIVQSEVKLAISGNVVNA
jgi:hypothetical protein